MLSGSATITHNRSMHRSHLTTIVGVYLSAVCGLADAGYQVGVTVWDSEGMTTWNHDASALSPLLGDPTSELTYQNLKSDVLEVNWRADLQDRFYLKAAYGVSDSLEGELLDDDFVSAQGATFFGTTMSGEHRFSRTLSDIDGDDLSYFNLVFGRELLNKSSRKRILSAFVGYQKWREKYIATGLTQLECTAPPPAAPPGPLCNPVGFTGFSGERVISNELEWTSIFIGVGGTVQLSKKMSFDGTLAYTPVAKIDNDDIHHLRTDLRKDPSFAMSGEGDGWMADIAIIVQIKESLTGEFGYRYWRLEVKDGDWTSFPASGSPIDAKLNDFVTERKGLFVEFRVQLGD